MSASSCRLRWRSSTTVGSREGAPLARCGSVAVLGRLTGCEEAAPPCSVSKRIEALRLPWSRAAPDAVDGRRTTGRKLSSLWVSDSTEVSVIILFFLKRLEETHTA
jgi:hypothetical protein